MFFCQISSFSHQFLFWCISATLASSCDFCHHHCYRNYFPLLLQPCFLSLFSLLSFFLSLPSSLSFSPGLLSDFARGATPFLGCDGGWLRGSGSTDGHQGWSVHEAGAGLVEREYTRTLIWHDGVGTFFLFIIDFKMFFSFTICSQYTWFLFCICV